MKQFYTFFRAIQIAILVLFIATPQAVYAVKAISTPKTITQPDGTSITIRVHGDEFFSYYTTADGYIIAPGKDGCFYFADYNTGKLSLSTIKARQGAIGFTKSIPQSVIENQKAKAYAQITAMTAKAMTKAGTKHPEKVLVILAQYQDIKFTTPNTKQAFWDLMNKKGYTASATGSVADYFEDNSMGAFRPEFVITDPVTLPRSRSFYGKTANDANGGVSYQTHAKDACNAANPSVNFADFDSNNDGAVDLVLIYYAGHNPAEHGPAEAVWPHRWVIGGNFMLDNKIISDYACTSELKGSSGSTMTGIGTMCHEYGHTLGLKDVYDTRDRKEGVAYSTAMMGSLSLMDGGNYNNGGMTPPFLSSFEREIIGWLSFEDINKSGKYTLGTINENKAYRIPTKNPGEFFVLENRQSTEWDRFINNKDDGKTPKGLMILHIDRSQNIVGTKTAYDHWLSNTLNTYPEHQCVDLKEACGYEYANLAISDVLYPGTKNNISFNNVSTPNNRMWNGNKLGVDITNISLSGSNVTFDVNIEALDPAKVQLSGIVKDFRGKPLRNAIITFTEGATMTKRSGIFTHSYFQTLSTKAAVLYSTTTNSLGAYELTNVIPKEYLITVFCEGYETSSFTKLFEAGTNTLDITLKPVDGDPDLSTMKWYNESSSMIAGIAGQSIFFGVMFTPSDLKMYDKEMINKVYIKTNGTIGGELTLKSGDKVIATKTVSSSIKDGFVTFDLSSESIYKNDNEPLNVIIKCGSSVYLDNSAAIDGKGNLISVDGVEWTTAKTGAGIDGNWVIAVELADAPFEGPYVKNLVSSSIQQEAKLNWKTSVNTITKWKVKWKKLTESTFSEKIVDKEYIVLKNLEIGQNYYAEVGPIITAGVEPVNYTKLNFTTKSTTAPFPAILMEKVQYAVGDTFLMALQNKNSGIQNIVFKVNGTVVTEDTYVFATAGDHKITAEVTYTTGGTEIITKKINVITK